MVIANNVVADNFGHGLHPDVLSDDVVISGNVVVDNEGAGIHFETSTNASIVDNVVEGNGYKSDGSSEPGILVLDSDTVEIARNELDGNALGILVRQDSRDGKPRSGNVTITGNTVVAPAGSRSGVGQIPASHPIGSVTFANNHYTHVDNRPFTWDGTTYTPADWQSVRNQDAGSTFVKA
jgi:parallel beta-helix repeat protein